MHDIILQADLCQHIIRAVALSLSPYMICERLKASNEVRDVCARAANGNGLQGNIQQNGSGTMPMLGPDVQQLTVQVERVTPDILHVKIGAPGRWEVPRSIFNAPNVTGEAEAELFTPKWLLCKVPEASQLYWPLAQLQREIGSTLNSAMCHDLHLSSCHAMRLPHADRPMTAVLASCPCTISKLKG